MKRFASLLLAALFSPSAFAVPSPYLGDYNFIDLNRSSSMVETSVNYPGMHNRGCGVEVRVSTPYPYSIGLTLISERLEVRNGNGAVEGRLLQPILSDEHPVLKYKFANLEGQAYLTVVTLKTKDGSALEGITKGVGRPNRNGDPITAIVTLLDCDKL